MIPYGKQNISQTDIDAVVEVLQSDFITQGPKVPAFEQAIANYCHANHAVATNSATSALHIACLALDVNKSDTVWTSPISFVASANCALYCGAKIDFVDIDINTANMSVQSLKEKLILAKANNSLPKVIIVVHIAGQSCPMDKIHELANKYNVAIIEDASHAVGAKFQDKPVGCGEFSDITIFSFHPVKIITTAEGGIALTNNNTLAKKMRLYRSHGITSTQEEMSEASHGPWYYQQIALGFNYRMTELQAALGLSQFTRLDEFVGKRNTLAKIYDEAFKESAVTPIKPSNESYSSYHLYLILLANDNEKKHKDAIIALRESNICAHVHYIPIHLQPYYQKLGFHAGDFPASEEYYRRVISLPLYPDLTPNEQSKVIDEVKRIVG